MKVAILILVQYQLNWPLSSNTVRRVFSAHCVNFSPAYLCTKAQVNKHESRETPFLFGYFLSLLSLLNTEKYDFFPMKFSEGQNNGVAALHAVHQIKMCTKRK